MTSQLPDSIHEAFTLLRSRELTVVELVESVLERAGRTEPYVHAYAYLNPDAVRVAAELADAELSAGTDRGPLHGIPIGVKDVFLTADMPTQAGSLVSPQKPGRDARAVQLLRDAGAIIIGKQVTHEFAAGQDVPLTRNAWNYACYPGGSTAGGAVSVAVGSSLAAIGTDAGGSVRKPAALNGIVGLKPTFGRISRQGVVAPSGSMDHVGLLARTVRDLPLLLDALCRRDILDETLVDEDVPDFTSEAGRGLDGVRLGICDYFTGDGCTPAVADAFNVAVADLLDAGATIVKVTLPTLEFSLAAGGIINQGEAGASHRASLVAEAARYGTGVRSYFEAGAIMPRQFLDTAHRARREICQDFRHCFESQTLDALITPTTGMAAMPLSEMVISRDLERYVRFTVVGNLTGLPAITVPCGLVGGLPVGLQLIGRPFSEPRLIGIAQAYEMRNNWLARRPPLPSI